MPDDWLSAVAAARAAGEACVLVTVAKADGSTPRSAGTKMVVFADRTTGTIGGGNLEYEAIARARRLLAEGAEAPVLDAYPLGPALGQCCGGQTTVMFEPLRTAAHTLLLFGAGHVGRALVGILAGLPFRVRWIDSRQAEFPASWPDNVTIECGDAVEAEVDAAPPGAFFLVMTYSHDIDLRLVEAILRRGDFAYLGLIGSRTKRARFERRLRRVGLDPDRLVCPIGIGGIPGKHPRHIAVAVAAQLLQRAAEVDDATEAEADGPAERETSHA